MERSPGGRGMPGADGRGSCAASPGAGWCRWRAPGTGIRLGGGAARYAGW